VAVFLWGIDVAFFYIREDAAPAVRADRVPRPILSLNQSLERWPAIVVTPLAASRWA